jgi:YegS/Rv2252/BmrU family lipid kinase
MADAPLLIVNPASGGGRTGRTFAACLETIEAALGPVEIAKSARAGHAIDLAREGARAGHRRIVAVGGDGTFHEVVNGVLDSGRDDVRVGLIAQGTGGDFRRTLGLEHRLDHYLANLVRDRIRRIDVGRVFYRTEAGEGRRWFVNVLSAGMGGLVDRYVARSSRLLGGSAAYFGASAKALLACREGRLRARVELAGASEDRKLRSFMIAICNGRYFGGGMRVAPHAELDDGRFDVVSLGASSKLALAWHASRIYDGGHLRAPGVESFACDRLELDLENDDARGLFLNDVDGEQLGGLPIRVELHRGALAVVA